MGRNRFLNAVICVIILTFIITLVSGCSNNEAEESKSGPNNSGTTNSEKSCIMLGGSGSHLSIIGELSNAFMEQNPAIRLEITEHLGSAGGINSVNQGLIDIGLVSREFLPEEQTLGLEYIPYAKVLIGFAVNNNVKIENLTEDQLLGIYTAKITNWKEVGGPDHEIIVLTRELTESSRIVWDRCLNGFKNAGNLPGAILIRTDQTMNEAITSIPYSIGWTDMGGLTLEYPELSMLKINGVSPEYEMVLNGKYPYAKELALVTKGKPAGDALKFIDFIRSSEGTRILTAKGYLAAGQD
ncbi:substrate-binding domain-containing protein [Phosphitispora sp. TUW77]|uniref:substrate-binding domain-containing protein n=1 Tax=Phosphitispora sp. TUW77 TaxID=3152361 RepID=UPI003AB5B3DC